MLIAQISDTHIKAPGRLAYGRVDTAAALSRCVEALRRLTPAPDLVLVTGDLVDFGTSEEYTHFQTLTAPLGLPLHVLPGNHDDRDALRAAWPETAWALPSGPLHQVIDTGPVRIVCLDSVIPDQGGGRLDRATLLWLDATLAEAPSRPTMVALHHPPFPSGIVHMDAIRLDGADAFADILRRHPQVERVVCGHLHRSVQAMVGGRLAMSAPQPRHQVVLDLTRDAPSRFVIEPPSYLLHLWHPESGLISHTVTIGDFGAHYPFFKDGDLID